MDVEKGEAQGPRPTLLVGGKLGNLASANKLLDLLDA